MLAYWDDRVDQLMVYASTQVPHVIRVGLAEFLGIDQGQVRVISPDVGGGFGYKVVVQPEELCVAWLALKFRRPFRYIEDRREHLVVGANSRQHHYRLTAYADARGRLKALDAEITIDGGAYSAWPFTVALEPGQAIGNLPGPYDFRGYRCRTHCVATNKPGFLPYRGVARTGVCFAMELMIDAIARAGRTRSVGGAPREPRAGRGHALRQRDAQALRQRRLSAKPQARAREDRPRRVARAPEEGRAGRPPHRHRLCHLLRAVRARHQRVLRPGACRSFRATTRRPCG